MKQIVKCPDCKREIATSKSEGIQCRTCGRRFDL